ncbi:hypothetical protein [Nostoc sp. CCY 9925]|uniref:hypothetical protein n=1 Tax=Nostoc sp. CCY 9925 TaxID=3103865 RepID=UPI0039C74FF2
MSQKNETAVLVLALLLTVGIVAAGVWWFTRNAVNISNTITQKPSEQEKIYH